MRIFTFELNGKPMSALKIDTRSFPAFSGLGDHANKRQFVCVKGLGPIPPGSYFVVDRQSGGLLGPLRELFTDKGDWLALYADDGFVDDETLCDQVKRGNFRIHPKGPLGRSEGCITIESRADFNAVRALIRAAVAEQIPGSQLKAYAKVVVK
jgi:hypothetical protein